MTAPHAHHDAGQELGKLPEEDQGMRLGWIVAIMLAVGMVGFMLFDGFQSETSFYEVDKAVAQGKDLVGRQVKIKGVVEPGTVSGKDGELGRKFRIAEKGKSIAVTYDRALPDTFQEGLEVVATGTVDADYVLHADEVLVKCPSRYEGNPPTGMEQQGEAPASMKAVEKPQASLD